MLQRPSQPFPLYSFFTSTSFLLLFFEFTLLLFPIGFDVRTGGGIERLSVKVRFLAKFTRG